VVSRKGGYLAGIELTPETANQFTHGVVAVAETLGDLLHGLAFDKNRTERLVLTVPRVGGLEEERTITSIVHS
jgi:hypothetical protein